MEHLKEKPQRSFEKPERAIQPIVSHFPEKFQFFNLGTLQHATKRASSADLLAQMPLVIGFRLMGEEQGYCMIGVDEPFDCSMHTEMANVLAAKIANHITDSTGEPCQISPPELVKSPDSAQLAQQRSSAWLKNLKESHNAAIRDYDYIPSPDQDGIAVKQKIILIYIPGLSAQT